MVGFFDPVIATALRDPIRGAVQLLSAVDVVELVDQVHAINTDGPTGAGWSDQGTFTRKDFDTTAFAILPTNVKGVLIDLSVGIDWLSTQPVGTLNSCYVRVHNLAAALNFGMLCSQSCSSQAGVPTDYFQNDNQVWIPCVAGSRTLRLDAHWPNLATQLPATYAYAYIVGYSA